jgi:secondary thiamine-phosphate synthase enzyme
MFTFQIKTKGEPCEIFNINQQVQNALDKSGIKEGLAFIWAAHTTCALTVIEDEPGHRQDIVKFLEKYIPSKKTYHHDATWGDANGYAHLRSFFIKPDLTVLVSKGKLVLGTWQNLVLLDFDNKPRTRKIYVRVSNIE